MKLIDMVRTRQFKIHPAVLAVIDKPMPQAMDFLVGVANEAVPVEVSNVFDWYQTDWLSNQADGSNLFDYFADIRFAFDVMWFEWSKGNGSGRRALCCISNTEGTACRVLLIDQCLMVSGKTPYFSHLGELHTEDRFGFLLDPNQLDPDEDYIKHSDWLIINALFPALLSQSLMNCKNVIVNQEPAPSKKREKKFAKTHNGVKVASYRTIVIDPMKAAVRSAGSGPAATSQRMHIIRGHFKTYTEDRKLFGKVAGKFFFTAHVAGDPALGMVQSEYVVKAKAS